MADSPHDLTELLIQWSNGNKEALKDLMPLVYGQLRRVAAGHLRHERPNHTLESAAVVNEAYLRLIDQQKVHWQNRAHFFGHRRPHHAGDSGGSRAKPSDRQARAGS